MPDQPANPTQEKRLLYRAHICYLETALRQIIDGGGFGEVSIKIRDGRVFEITTLQSNRDFDIGGEK